VIYRRDGRTDEARAALDAALAIDPAFAPANNELGVWLREHGEIASAEAAYVQALDTDPSYATAHYNLAILLDVYLRRPAEALPHYQQYQQSLVEPDETVARWIVDLERRLRAAGERVAQDDAP
jgi:lipoprotein NlpI